MNSAYEFTIENIDVSDAGRYYCIVSNSCGSVTSDIAILESINTNNESTGETYIDPTAMIDSTAVIGEGNYINSYSVIGANARTGQNVYIGNNCTIGANVVLGNDVIIDDGIEIGANTIIKDNSEIGKIITNCLNIQDDEAGLYTASEIGSNVVIGKNSKIGSNVLINNDARIGNNVIIANDAAIGIHSQIGNFVHINRGAGINDSVNISDGSYLGNHINTGKKDIIGINVIIRDSSTISTGLHIRDNGIVIKNTVLDSNLSGQITNPLISDYTCEFAKYNAKIYGNFLNGFRCDTSQILISQTLPLNQLLNSLSTGGRLNNSLLIKDGFRVDDKINFYANNRSETYEWDLGDCSTSTDSLPKHKYTKPGIYVIKLIQTSNQPCTLNKIYIGAITVYPVDKATFTQTDTLTCNDMHKAIFRKEHKLSNMLNPKCFTHNGVCISYETLDSASLRIGYQWDFNCQNQLGQNQISSNNHSRQNNSQSIQQLDSAKHNEYLTLDKIRKHQDTLRTMNNYNSDGEQCAQLTSIIQVKDLITGNWIPTASIFSYKDTVIIQAVYHADFKMPESACTQDSIAFTDISKHCSPISYYWYFGNNLSSALKNPKIVLNDTGNYDIKLVVKDTAGIKDSITKTIYVGNYCDIKGILLGSTNCNSNPATNDTLVFKNRLGLRQGQGQSLEAITDNSGHFAFNLRNLHNITTDSTKYRIDLKRGVGVEDTTARTLAEWISLSPLNLRLKKVVMEWVEKYGNVDTSGVATAVDLADNVYVVGTSNVNSNTLNLLSSTRNNLSIQSLSQLNNISQFITLIKYGADGSRKWVANYIDSIDCNSNGLSIDKNFNVYISGYKRDKFLILKYDTAGNLQWSSGYKIPNNQNLSPSTCSIKVDNSGNTYILDMLSFGQTMISCGSLNFTKSSYKLIKFNSSGAVRWVKTYGDSEQNILSFSWNMGLDSLCNVYASGGIISCQNSNVNVYQSTIKYDTTGQQIWDSIYLLNDTLIVTQTGGMKVDGTGNVYISGNKLWLPMNSSNRKGFTIKYNNSGNKQWIRNTNDMSEVSSLNLSASQDVYISGKGLNNNSQYKVYKYSTDGEKLWDVLYDVDGIMNLDIYSDIDKNDNIYLTGTNIYENNNVQVLSIKYNNDGGFAWDATYNDNLYPEGLRSCYARNIKVSPNNNVYIVGTEQRYDSITSLYYSELTTIKYSQCPESEHLLRKTHQTFSHMKQTVKNTAINIYPNPNDGSFTLDAQMPNDGNVSIDAYNILGKMVLSQVQYMHQGDNTARLQIKEAKKGIYLINVRTESEVFNRKMMVE